MGHLGLLGLLGGLGVGGLVVFRGRQGGYSHGLEVTCMVSQLFFTTKFSEWFSRAILSQLGAQHGPTRHQLGFQNRPKQHPRTYPQSHFTWKAENLNFANSSTVLLYFWCPRGPLGHHVSSKTWCLDTTCHPSGSPGLLWTTLVLKMSKMGSQLGPQHGGNELGFSTLEPSWLHLGANLPPKWPQDPPRAHLGTILGRFWCHFGAIFVSLLCNVGDFFVQCWCNFGPKLVGKMCPLGFKIL